AGDASNWANTAQAAATAAGQSADSAAASAAQAHKVTDIAREADQERLDEQQANEMAAADEASREADLKAKTAAWESGKTTQLAADTDQLLKDATAAGVDPKTAVLKGRQAALRLLDAGGPWVRTAAQTALEGDDTAVQTFLTSTLAVARDRDDRTSALAISQAPGKTELRLAAETASVGTTDQVRAFLTTGQYPGKDDDDRVQLSQIMAAGGPGVKAAAGQALSGTIDDVRAFLATGQFKARDDDNRVLVTQLLTTGGPEVKAAAQAVLSGPADRLVPFLQTGLQEAQQRDAVTAAHVATIQSYLAAIDGSVALARQYAAQASQSYATARGAADEAAGYANQASASAAQAADWSSKAAQSAQAAKASADQAAAYAQQAQTSAANANAAAGRASASAALATGYAAQAHQYAATAKAAADQAQASAAAAQVSAAAAAKAAADAQAAVFQKQQAEAAAAQTPSGTAGNDGTDGSGGNNGGRAYYVESVPHGDMVPVVVDDGMSKCTQHDPGDGGSGTYGTILSSIFGSGDKTWHNNAAGVMVCTVTVKMKISGTVDYVMRTCPEAGLTVDACKGKYTTWDTVVLNTQHLDGVPYETTIDIPYTDYKTKYDPKVIAGKMFWDIIAGDFVKCFNNPGLNASCAWAAATLIPVGKLADAAKGIVAFKYAVETGVGIEDARLALQATLNGYSGAVLDKLNGVADLVAKFRLTLKDGVGTDDALAALRNNPDVDKAVINELQIESDVAKTVRTVCKTANSFPAGTAVLMADGTTRPIERIRIGDTVTATDPTTGVTSAQRVENTIYTPDDRDFTELTIAAPDGSTAAITSTGHHPYWSQNTRTWRDAADLTAGDTLRTPDGRTAQVTATRSWTTLQPAYNLTVSNVHTYYVLAGTTPVLVHNSGGLPCLDVPVDEVNNAFHPATYDTPEKQFLDHYNRWGKPAGMTQRQYLDTATALTQRLSQPGGAVGPWVKNLTDIGYLEDRLKGFKYLNKDTGELLITSLDGKVVTYHPPGAGG
ncbi:polymorphic toxin-type HINT domain-containing protein, partial [Kitasatospora nipponensis]|uniref:polymorphic toxin-type HINT domain-containing protein n=1 Tax=Kitasatospora nipponensis TaxID=258049 RepID=UPI0031DA455C